MLAMALQANMLHCGLLPVARVHAPVTPSSLRCRASVMTEVIASADEGGTLAGPFWDMFCEEAGEEAEALGLVLERMSFAGGKLNVLASGGGVDELQALNSHLSSFIDAQADEEGMAELPPFLLEVSSPGLSGLLTSDKDFAAFKGFPVTVSTSEPFKSKTEWEGTLVSRDAENIVINLKGRQQKIPKEIVLEVRLPSSKTEAGDPYA